MNPTYDALFASSAARHPLGARSIPSKEASGPGASASAHTPRSAEEPIEDAPTLPAFPERSGVRRKRTFVLSADVDDALTLAMGYRYHVHGENKSEVVEGLLRLHGYAPGGTIR